MKRLLHSLILLSGIIFPATVLAQNVEVPPQVIAQVRVQNCTLKQEDRYLAMACDFINAGKTTVTDIHYALQFLTQGSQGLPVDTLLSPDAFSLGAGRTYHKEWKLAIPSYLNGHYELVIKVANQEGLPLASSSLGSFTTTSESDVLIQGESCHLTIEGKGDTKYTLSQGVDIALDENLIAKCLVTNLSDQTHNLTPSFVTHYRTIFGSIVPTQSYTQTLLTLNSKETKEYTFSLPKATLPQAYDTTLALTKDNQPITNTVTFHYVIQGATATIQTLTTNKTFYHQGETAVIKSFFTGSADSFPNSRGGGTQDSSAKLHVTIKSNDALCGESTEEVKQKSDQEASLNVSINNTCTDPTVTLQILDNNNQVLAERTVTIPTNPEEKQAGSITDSLAEHWLKILIIFLIILPLFIYLIAHLNRKSPKRFALFFLLFLLGGLFGGAGEVRGDTFSNGYWTFTNGISKSSYSPGESIGWSFLVQYSGCGNSQTGYDFNITNIPASDTYNYSTGLLYCDAVQGECLTFLGRTDTFNSSNTGKYFTAPSSSGTYNVSFNARDYFSSFTTNNLSYSVTAPAAINGSCGASNNACTAGTLSDTTDDSSNYLWDCNGSGGGTTAYCSLPKPVSGTCGGANGVAVSSAPTSGFCSTGTSSGVTGTGPWNWNCNGSGGGSTATCSAPTSGGGGGGGGSCTVGSEVTINDADGFADMRGAAECSTNNYITSAYGGTGMYGNYAPCDVGLTAGGTSARGACISQVVFEPRTGPADRCLVKGYECASASSAISGTCGSSNGGSFSSAPGANLCNAGTTSWTDSTAADNSFNWNCTGSGGGSTASCTANKTSSTAAGACGSANGADAWSTPSSGLCNVGTPSVVSGTGPWSWSCVGSSTAYCSAPKGPATPSVTLTINGTTVSNNYYGGGVVPTINVAKGDNLNLIWSSTNTTSCQALSGPGWMTNPKATGGNDNVAATVSGDYTVQCIGAPAASGGNYVAAAKISINIAKKLTVCKNSCNSNVVRGVGGSTTSATYTPNQSENWVACYSASVTCQDTDPSADVTTSTTWGEQGGNTAASLSGTNPKVMTMSAGGSENLTATYNNNVTSSPLNSYYDLQTDYTSFNFSTFTYDLKWVAGSGIPKLGGGTPPNWTPASLGVGIPSSNTALNAASYQSNGVTLVSSSGTYPASAGSWNTWRLIANTAPYNETATINVGASCSDSGACARDGRSQSLCAKDSFTVTDACGVTQTCTGAKSCDYNWKEVEP